MNRFVLAFSVFVITAMSAFAAMDYFDIWIKDGGFAPFTSVRISATTDNSYSPLSSDGTWYNGFSSAPDVRIYSPVEFVNAGDDWIFTSAVRMDIANMDNYWFAVELLNVSGQVVAYQGYLDWGAMDLARSWVPEGYAAAEFSHMTAAPIPEPASGLLLLMGGALLGLRRKRRVA